MKLHNSSADIFVPDQRPLAEALARITHLGIGAHPDDLEFMAFHGIVAGYARHGFAGVTCTNGSGSARTGSFAGYTDEQMIAVRRQEQRRAAELGQYGVMFQLDFSSRCVKAAGDFSLRDDLRQILQATRPQYVYTHNPADKHDTHISVVRATLAALRSLPVGERPQKVYGCEGWRDLDWLPDEKKVLLDVTGHEELAGQLNAVFVSQVAGGKRYDLAVAGRRRANATFVEINATDKAAAVIFAMDLTPLMGGGDVAEYATGLIEEFRADVQRRLTG
jgi:LmbE family N-acetylglucosaminyl deacetylase